MLRFGSYLFFSHLIGREAINIPQIFSGVHCFTGKTLKRIEICMAMPSEALQVESI